MNKAFMLKAARLAVAVLLFIAGCLPSFAFPGTARQGGYTSFRNISFPCEVYCALEDEDGLVWFGTRQGLSCYNGFDIHTYPFGEFTSDRNVVQALLQKDERTLYVGTDGGILEFDTYTRKYGTPDAALTDVGAVRSLLFWEGMLWIGSRDGGLLAFNPAEHTLRHIDGTGERTIYNIVPIDKEIYVCAYGALFRLDGSGRMDTVPIDEGEVVHGVCPDRSGRLWIGTEGNLYRIDQSSGAIGKEPSFSGNIIKAIVPYSGDSFLVGSDNGLYVFDTRDGSSIHVVHDIRESGSLVNNLIQDILSDKEGNIWVSTDRGVSLYQADQWYQCVDLSNITYGGEGNVIYAMLEGRGGDYWIGGDNGLIHVLGDRQSIWYSFNSREHHLRNNHIRDIYRDREDMIWICTDGGIASYDTATSAFTFYDITDEKGRNANWSYGILEDSSGTMWIATFGGGLYAIDKKRILGSGGAPIEVECAFSGDDDETLRTVYLMEMDSEGNIWADSWKGLARIDPIRRSVELKDLWFDNITIDGDVIWGSDRGSLYRYDTKKGAISQLPFKISQGSVYAFTRDKGRIWFSCADGILYIDTRTLQVNPTDIPGRYYRSALYEKGKDRILWGGEDCITVMSTLWEKGPSDRKVYITGIYSGDDTLLEWGDTKESPIHLHDRRNPVLELSTLSYSSQGPGVFYYRIDDEPTWHSLPPGVNSLSFPTVPGGKFSLELSTADPLSDESAQVSTYSLRVPYPWYSSILARILYGLLAIAAVAIAVRAARERNRRKLEALEKEKVLEISRMKTDFFENMSHELKTPLSLIIAPLGDIISKTPQSKTRERLEGIQSNAMRLSNLIYKILDFKDMEYESDNSLIRSNIELGQMARDCVKTFSHQIESKDVDVSIDTPSEGIWINADRMKLESVVTNILSNALKYVPDKGGKIGLDVSREGSSAKISISDNGRGIPKKDLKMIFVRFYQSGGKGNPEGTGIGLFLAKKYVEMHGGTIEAKSKGGATFTITLPLDGDNLASQSSAEPAEAGATAEGKRLLIIDDNSEMVEFLVNALSPSYRCQGASNGKEALEMVKKEKPDLVIVDQMMPLMDGMEFTRRIRKDYPTSDIPVIMLTAKDDIDTEMESVRSGVDIFLSKPFDMRKLQVYIAKLMDKYSHIRKAAIIENISQGEVERTDIGPSSDEILMEKIVSAVEESMDDEQFSVASLAQSLSMDQKQLYRKVKQLTGLTPVAYIRQLRMKKAAVLLRQGQFNVTEVMYMVGYSSASHFSKCFTEQFGVSPRQYASATEEPGT